MVIVDLELRVRCDGAGQQSADLLAELVERRVELAAQVPIQLNLVALRALVTAPEAYGAALSAMLFVAELRAAWQQARAYAEGAQASLRVRLVLEGDEILHRLHWELLRDPLDNLPLANSERVRFSRFLSSPGLVAPSSAARSSLHVAAAVASPPDLPTFQLQPIDVAGEVQRLQQSLGETRLTILDGQGGRSAATLPAIVDVLRGGVHALYLVCHGTLVDEEPYLWLEAAGSEGYRPTPGEWIVRAIAQMEQRPSLVVLATCMGAGDTISVLTALGPQLARAGVGAVLALHGQVPVDLVVAFMPHLFRELRRDGQIDRAVAAARGTLPHDSLWWLPVLWMSVRDGSLWQAETGATAPGPPEPRTTTFQVVSVSGGQVGSIIGSQQNYGAGPTRQQDGERPPQDKVPDAGQAS
jgi:hypothetical protein